MRTEALAIVITDSKAEERMVSLTTVDKSNGMGEFIINTGDVVITLPLEKLRIILGGDKCAGAR